MIVVTVELWRYGNPDDRETLGVGVIYNDATGSETRGNYKFYLSKRRIDILAFAKSLRQPGRSVWKSGEVTDFPRKRLLAWDLLSRCLAKVCR
jgi:hypothetical protein